MTVIWNSWYSTANGTKAILIICAAMILRSLQACWCSQSSPFIAVKTLMHDDICYIKILKQSNAMLGLPVIINFNEIIFRSHRSNCIYWKENSQNFLWRCEIVLIQVFSQHTEGLLKKRFLLGPFYSLFAFI